MTERIGTDEDLIALRYVTSVTRSELVARTAAGIDRNKPESMREAQKEHAARMRVHLRQLDDLRDRLLLEKGRY